MWASKLQQPTYITIIEKASTLENDFFESDYYQTIRQRIDLEVKASNLFNQQTYTQVNYSDLNIYRNVCQLRPMNVVAKVRFKLL